ncbi:DUF3141 domain-containing protein [Paracoccus sp. MBLB3053]|uniref:DUF3141 domain-containing protein n=1 Tax=Paracoccus aurantius TaxID=3073814 RepID=A0ABU2HV31_9RHOB|nr:DUF3141 domain-containing protein [Paracoccus sp. MBLB3053]MDS9468908.1 DUF3141 domain-containing protein [Paracoccus sp. MBLB3053]
MPNRPRPTSKPTSATEPPWALPFAAHAYLLDSWQRSVLYLDVMRQRAEQYREHAAQELPHVLDYKAELICDGRELDRPVNYLMGRILPEPGNAPDPRKRPFVVIDPRAGHGPGIGGFKADSEIGVALRAGHPCYFIGFLPEPMPGQTIEDVVHAKAEFLRVVIARHPEAEGKPCVIGNCQAGWSVTMVAALYPELFGPIILAGSPLSYWAGVRGQNPMRYSGGLLGGSWLTALTGDLGGGVFDGAWLVQNFENQNPANTYWTKQYNLWSKIDSEAERYLGFEKWWGGHVLLNAEEMQFIVDELFVGNHLAAGEIRTNEGKAIDLRNIRAPIVVFCSKGDNITPPQQALDWILELYDSVDDIRACGQTIVYTVHERIGHLGIFVSAGVARKEHQKFASNIDMLDLLPPGLYEAKLTPKGEAVRNPELVTGEWVMRCEERTLDDIRAIGSNDPEDERRFDAAARLSEMNLAIYRTFAQPVVRAMIPPGLPSVLQRMHPLRLQYEFLGPGSALAGWIGATAEHVRAERRPVSPANPFLAMQERVSEQIVAGFETMRQISERWAEEAFLSFYGRDLLQSALGVDQSDRPKRKAAISPMHAHAVSLRIAELRAAMGRGGMNEALARSLFYAGAPRGGVDERSFEAVRRFCEADPDLSKRSFEYFRKMLREQFFMLLIDEDAAMAALPKLLPADETERRAGFEMLKNVLSAAFEPDGEVAVRLRHLAELFGVGDSPLPLAKGSEPKVSAATTEAPEPKARDPETPKPAAPKPTARRNPRPGPRKPRAAKST